MCSFLLTAKLAKTLRFFFETPRPQRSLRFLIGFLRALRVLSGKKLLVRLFDKASSIGRFFEAVYNSLDAVLDSFHVPVYQ
jgi:hypothetical protein